MVLKGDQKQKVGGPLKHGIPIYECPPAPQSSNLWGPIVRSGSGRVFGLAGPMTSMVSGQVGWVPSPRMKVHFAIPDFRLSYNLPRCLSKTVLFCVYHFLRMVSMGNQKENRPSPQNGRGSKIHTLNGGPTYALPWRFNFDLYPKWGGLHEKTTAPIALQKRGYGGRPGSGSTPVAVLQARADPFFSPRSVGPPARCPFSPNFFGWEGSPTKIDYRTKFGALLLTSLLEDLDSVGGKKLARRPETGAACWWGMWE